MVKSFCTAGGGADGGQVSMFGGDVLRFCVVSSEYLPNSAFCSMFWYPSH